MIVPIRPTLYHNGYEEGKQIGRAQGRRDGALGLRRALTLLRSYRRKVRLYRDMSMHRGDLLVQVNERQFAAIRERDELRDVLRQLVRDEWAGIGANADEDRWVCFYCQDTSELGPGEEPPAHEPDCPLRWARERLIEETAA